MIAQYGNRTTAIVASAAILLGGLAASCSGRAGADTCSNWHSSSGSPTYAGQVPTSDGSVRGTLVPVTLADGGAPSW